MFDEWKIWAMGFVTVALISAMMVSCTINNSNRKAEAIANGTDAGEAACAFDYSRDEKACLIRAARGIK